MIRNFCIIAHIDHGKSTLADRMLETTWTIRKSNKKQVLDRMDLEQERGITIKLTPVRMQRKGYEFNLIDTPGHVDFQYEVSRSLAAVEWVILLIDASQWIQAQTLSTLYMAIEQNLKIIPVLNKIDLPAANPTRVAQEIEHVIGINKSEIIAISAKTWENVNKVLDTIIEKIQDPKIFKQNNTSKFISDESTNLQISKSTNLSRALIFDSVYDPYKWILSYIKVVDGQFKANQEVQLIYTNKIIKPTEVWYFNPEYQADKTISEGQIGYIITGEKSVRDAQIWDTLINWQWEINNEQLKNYAIPGFKTVQPFVYAGVYPIKTNEYDKLKESLEKLSLNDSAIEYDFENSKALWFGFRCGFLGMLHMDIIKERLSREYNIETIFTTPTVPYLVKCKNFSIEVIKSGKNIKDLKESWLDQHIQNFIKSKEKNLPKFPKSSEILQPRILVKSWTDMIEQGMIEKILEPISEVEIVWPQEYAGNIMELCQKYRGKLKNMEHLDESRVVRKYHLPLGEIIVDFYDRLKSATKGYATMNYEFKKYEQANLIKLNVLVNDEQIEALSRIVHKDKAYQLGKQLCEKLKEHIPKHMFVIPIQAAIGTKIIARETIRAMKKDVIAKCYGGDVSRKRKLLQKQKEGKKKMKAMGNVNVPSDLFIKMVTRN